MVGLVGGDACASFCMKLSQRENQLTNFVWKVNGDDEVDKKMLMMTVEKFLVILLQ